MNEQAVANLVTTARDLLARWRETTAVHPEMAALELALGELGEAEAEEGKAP